MWENLQHEFQRYFVDNGASEWWLNGLKTTILVTLLALCIGVVLGFLVALVRSTHEQTGKLKLLNAICMVYLTVIRGTPSMIQILIFYSVVFASIPLNNIIIGGIAFGINSGAYVAEIVRGGLMSVDMGQTEAGRSLGLNYLDTMRFIVIPQAFKNILPSLGNEFITLFKDTSLVNTIGLTELTYRASRIAGSTFDYMPPYIGIALMYLVVVILLTWLQSKLERRLRQSDRR